MIKFRINNRYAYNSLKKLLLLLHSFNGLFCRTTRVSEKQKSRTILKPIWIYWSKR